VGYRLENLSVSLGANTEISEPEAPFLFGVPVYRYELLSTPTKI
jgi:hypothetical protein